MEHNTLPLLWPRIFPGLSNLMQLHYSKQRHNLLLLHIGDNARQLATFPICIAVHTVGLLQLLDHRMEPVEFYGKNT